MNNMRYLIFEVLGEQYALALEHVAEIMDPPAVYPVAKAPGYYRGVMNCHGRPVPVLDLSLVYKNVSSAGPGKILVLDGKTANLALLVHGIVQIVSGGLPAEPAPGGQAGVETKLVAADREIKLIEPSRLLEKLEQEMNG